MRRVVFVLSLVALAAGGIAAAGADSGRSPLSGPIPGFVERVVDGDTLRVRARIWLRQELVTDVRLRGVDTPELHGRCPEERQRARDARDFVVERVGGREVWLRDLSEDKYGGRIVARLSTRDGADLGAALLERGLAHAYGGGRKEAWCPK